VEEWHVITVGYEDCNLRVLCESGSFLVKGFASKRSKEEVRRYVDLMELAVRNGVNHPRLVPSLTTASNLIEDSATQTAFVVMEYVVGQTYLESDSTPTTEDLGIVLRQIAKFNAIPYEPPYFHDSWAIPNMQAMFDRVSGFMAGPDIALVQQVLVGYSQIPLPQLSKCLVHGDLTKGNVMRSDDGQVFILDFSVANWYPRIQELAIIAANLLFDKRAYIPLVERVEVAQAEYGRFLRLSDSEKRWLYDYTLAGVAMDFLGAHQEQYINGNEGHETDYWLSMGREGLYRELA